MFYLLLSNVSRKTFFCICIKGCEIMENTNDNTLHFNLSAVSGLDGNTQNNYNYSTTLTNLLLIAQNRFEWVDNSKIIKPETRLSQYIEFLLCFFGQCCIVKENGFIKVKKCVGSGSLNQYGVPETFTTMNYNGGDTKIYNINSRDFVWIQNNFFRLPTEYWLLNYANRISKVQRIQDINLDAHKTPYFIATTPNKLLSMRNIFNKIRSMAEAVFVDETKGIRENIRILKPEAPYIVDKLQDQKICEFNCALNFLGINTIDEKAERLVTSEGEISRELTGSYIDIFMKTRRQAVEEIKNKFNIDVDLKFNNNYKEYFEMEVNENNGNIYNNVETTD